MSRYIFDASAAYEYLIRTPAGLKIDALIRGSIPVTADLMDIEVISIARRNVRLDLLSDERASLLINSLNDWPIERISAHGLASVIWSLRDNFSAYDAFYVAVATKTGGTLLTLDRKLVNGPNLPCPLTVF